MDRADTPSISTSAYATKIYDINLGKSYTAGGAITINDSRGPREVLSWQYHDISNSGTMTTAGTTGELFMTRRLVQVFIADPDDKIPLEKALIYRGEQKFTDATDQELFFEIDINSILKKYNEERVKIVNKVVKERTEYLEPVKIRQLKMVVVEVAKF